LGLPIAKALIEAHHGKIGIESRPGQGTSVWFTVPRQGRV
jgi:signal transduction histidine kinase